MPHIVVKLWPGHSEEEKVAMTHALVEAASRTLHAQPEWFTVGVEEVSPEVWEAKVVAPEINGKADTLYFRQGEYLK